MGSGNRAIVRLHINQENLKYVMGRIRKADKIGQ
jgi:hypothetical protein